MCFEMKNLKIIFYGYIFEVIVFMATYYKHVTHDLILNFDGYWIFDNIILWQQFIE